MSVDYSQYPDSKGHFGIYGGIFAPETLMAALEDLNKQYESLKNDPEFLAELTKDFQDYVGRRVRFISPSDGPNLWAARKST